MSMKIEFGPKTTYTMKRHSHIVVQVRFNILFLVCQWHVCLNVLMVLILFCFDSQPCKGTKKGKKQRFDIEC